MECPRRSWSHWLTFGRLRFLFTAVVWRWPSAGFSILRITTCNSYCRQALGEILERRDLRQTVNRSLEQSENIRGGLRGLCPHNVVKKLEHSSDLCLSSDSFPGPFVVVAFESFAAVLR